MNHKIQNWINRFFRLEEINGHNQCPTYLYRWTLLRIGWFAAYLHHFVADDWSRDFHDHPKRFISIGLKGQYIEETPNGEREYHAPWLRSFPASHIHRIRLKPGKTCWTIAIVLKSVRPWGFVTQAGEWIPWRQYVNGDMKRKNCP